MTNVTFTKNKPSYKYLPLEIDRGDCCCCQDPIKITYEVLETRTNRGDFDRSMGAPGISFYAGPPSGGSQPDFSNMVPMPAWILENETQVDIVMRYDPLELMPEVPEDIFLYVTVRLESSCNDRFSTVQQEIDFCVSIIDTGYKPETNHLDESDSEFERSYFVNKLVLSDVSEDPVYYNCDTLEQGWKYEIGAYHGKLCRDSTYTVNIIDSKIYDEFILNDGDGVNLLAGLENSPNPNSKTPVLVALVKDNKRIFEGDPVLEGLTYEDIINSFNFEFNPEVMNINITEDDNIPDNTSQSELTITFIGDTPLPAGLFVHFDVIFGCDCGLNSSTTDGEDKTIFRRLPRPIVIETLACPNPPASDSDDNADDSDTNGNGGDTPPDMAPPNQENDGGVEGSGPFDNDTDKTTFRLIKYKIQPRCNKPTEITVSLREGNQLPDGFATIPNIAAPGGFTYKVKENPNQEQSMYLIQKPTSDPTASLPNVAPDEVSFYLVYNGGEEAGKLFSFNLVSSFTCDDTELGDEQYNGPVEGEIVEDTSEEENCPTETQVRINSITARNDVNLISPNNNSQTEPGCDPCESEIQ